MAAEYATVSNQTELLKRLYPNGVEDTLYKRSKVLGMIKKDTTFGAEGRYVAVKISPTGGGSADYSTARTNQRASDTKRFFVTHAKEYQLYTVENEAIQRTKGDKNALVALIKSEMDSAHIAFGRALSARFWGNGGGSLGRLDATTTLASTTILLRVPEDVRRFEIGMTLNLAADDGTGTSPAGVRSGTLEVVGVDRDAGTLTVDQNISAGIATATVNDYIFREGDYSVAMTGIPGWHPFVAPTTGDSFFGLDRSVEPQRLSGVRYDGASGNLEDTIISACAEGELAGVDVDMLAVNSIDYGTLVQELGAKREIQVEHPDGKFGFRALETYGPNGRLRIVSEPDCPQGYGWAINPADFYLRTAGECPIIINDNGKLLQQLEGADAKQGVLGCYGNFFSEKPGNVICLKW